MQNGDGTAAPKQRPLYPIASVDNALRLLLQFRTTRELRLSQAASDLGVANSTAHRLLAMLEYHGFVAQDPQTKVYNAGPALVDVGLAVARRIDLRDLARPLLEQLAAETGETTHVAILDGTDVRYLEAVESPMAVRVVSRTGMTLPAHCTSVGKALLAELDREEILALYPAPHLPPSTPRSITSRAELERELARVRELGYAVNIGESEEGVSSVATAVHHPQRGAVAAVSCASPTSRMSPKRMQEVAPLVIETGRRLAERLP